MTITAPPATTRSSGGARKPPPPLRKPPSVGSQIAGSVGTLVSLMLLTFVAEMVLVGPVRHAREQNVAYAELRSTMAQTITPTGQFDFEGKPVEPGTPLGLISIPSLGIREVYLEGTAAGVLMNGPGHRRDTPMPGQAGTSVLMGRQATYGGPFRRLGKVRIGADIAVRTGQGVLGFKVTGVRRAGDPQVKADPATAGLTLVTGDGTPFLPTDVVRVDAKLDPAFQVQPSPSRPFTSVTKSEESLSGDTGVLLPLLLWSQLLLLLAGVLAWVRSVWGRWQSWIVCVPVMAAVGLKVAHLVAQLLPNLL